MPTSSVSGDQVNFTVDQGATRSLQFNCQNPDGSALNLTGIVVEMVVQAIDGTQTAKILSTDVSNPMGTVSIPTPSNGIVQVTLSPTATAAIYNNRGGYSFWALWAQPGTTTEYTIVQGQIVHNRVAQP